MKSPTFAPAYVGLFPHLAIVAHGMGYALAVHGSVTRDFDLVAIPWTEDAVSATELMRAIADRVGQAMGGWESSVNGEITKPLAEPTQKPHGRLSWAIPTGNGSVIDLSVTPRKV